MKKKKLLSTFLCMGMVVALLGGCSGKENGDNVKNKDNNTKEKLVLMVDCADIPAMGKAAEMAKEHFADKYDIIIKEWNLSGVEKAIKTAAAGGEDASVDITFSSNASIPKYLDADLVLDLTPYVEEDSEWVSKWQDGALETSTFEGKTYALPFQTVYPLLLVNNEIMEAAEIEVKECWTWEEFQDVCKKVSDKTDAYPFGISADWAPWLLRTGFINAFEGEAYNQFVNGEIPMEDEQVKTVMNNVVDMYQKNYCYPGEGAVSATLDQINAAFAQKKIAMMGCVNSIAGKTTETSGLENVSVVTMPSFIHTDIDTQELGGNDAFFIPSNTKNKDAAVEVLKYLTGTEVFQMMADDGVIVPRTDIETSDSNYSLYSKDISRTVSQEIFAISPEVDDYLQNSLLVDYLYSGESALNNMQQLIDAVVTEK